LARYGLALAVVFIASLLRISLNTVWGVGLPYITFYPAVMLTALVGGLGPGILATILAALISTYFWLPPEFSLAIASLADALGLGVFVAMGLFISIVNDAWRRSAGALAESEQRLRVTVASIGDAVITTDDRGHVTRMNSVAETLTGWSAADAIGRALSDVFVIIDETARQTAQNPVYRVLEEGTISGLANHTLLVAKDGREVPIDDSAAPIRSDDGRMVGVVMVFREIAERRRIEREQAALHDQRARLLDREQAARAELEKASRLKDEFLAILSHELRTPLNAVLGYAHMLNSGKLPPERTRHAIAAIQRNAEAQARLVASLLDLSRIMAGKLELGVEPLDLWNVVAAALDVVRPDADSKSIALRVASANAPAIVVGDSGRLQQVFWNLLSNAIKFTPRGGEVTIGGQTDGRYVRITVTDNGQGIARDFLPDVFDRFKQGDQGGRSAAGLGLGLALVREMVQAHGGAVAADSPGPGGGSIFTVTLPLAAGAGAAVERSTGSTTEGSVESLLHLDVLVVDDDHDARELLTLLLESRGATVCAASSSAEALEALDVKSHGVLLADLGMPEEDGYSLIRRVRTRERERTTDRLPAIAVTVFATAADREKAIAAGYDAHVSKPVDPDALTRTIADVVGVGRHHAPARDASSGESQLGADRPPDVPTSGRRD
jgi:PAS domain S-box-containing protein